MLTFALVMLASYAVACILASLLVAAAWHTRLLRSNFRPNELLALRLVPSGGSALVVLAIVMPAFLVYEPVRETEEIGPLVWVLAAFSLLALGDGIRRGCHAWLITRSLSRYCGFAVEPWSATRDQAVDIVDVREPIVAVIGAWHPRIVAARNVLDACSQEEFRQVIAHEVAHLSARDNLKCLLLAVSPDPLAWLPVGTALAKRWRTAAEFEADLRATGSDPRNRVALAAALVKVARLATPRARPVPALNMFVASDDVSGRVRQLLTPPPPSSDGTAFVKSLAMIGLVLPVVALPLYAPLHSCIEAVVALGR
jgi:hypothetical protein